MVQENEVENVEFKWGIKRGVGGKKKDIQFYESFMYDLVEYRLYDSVYMYMENEPEPFVGKIIKIWETSDKAKKVKILWFFRPCEISNYLEDNPVSENELFLASGKGAGLANINPLEAIAGKCSAVCTSKDDRNPQPSNEELEMADFIFFRTFDVAQCVVSEKMDDEIAGVDVKLLFNKFNCQKTIDVPEFRLDKKETFENDILTKGTLVLPKNTLGESKTLSLDGDGVSLDISTSQRAKHGSPIDHELAEMANHTPESLVGGKSTSNPKGKEDVVATKNSSLGVKNTPNMGADLGEGHMLDEMRKDTTSNLRFKGKEILDLNPKMVEPKSLLEKRRASNVGVVIGKRTNNNGQDSSSYGKMTSKRKDHLARDGIEEGDKLSPSVVEVDDNLKPTKVSRRVDDGLHKKEQLDGLEKVCDETTKKTMQILHHGSCGGELKPNQIPIASSEKFKRELAKDSHASENYSSKKRKLDEHVTIHVDNHLPKASPSDTSTHERKSSSKTFEVTRRQEVEQKSKWFTGQAWKEWIPQAQRQGRLVLLQNLDPSYTMEEVQDIIWHAFKQSCSVMLIQRTAISSPYSGQAFVIFKTRQAAENMVQRSCEACLFLSNGRPLVASIANLSFLGRQTAFFGHISIDRAKLQMQREMKQAVSTSHCSQPNTVEYDLALDWCLLQERSELEWKNLYKRQGRELRELKDTLKSK
ncbi:hypothetical protein M5689_011442 [Euphorbia peplus]|nr:hypothetical protein M5689_011442 [Euphorbia peplus]